MNHKKLVLGVLAHVDAGKTTLSESILYLSKTIRKLGRVDHKNAFLDTHEMERARGITIFSKQAVFTLSDIDITLMDTPGHVDFSKEMERTLQVLDYAVLIISGADGIQGHTLTLWKILKHYQIPVFIFINKMDQNNIDKNTLLKELSERLSEHCIDFGCQNQQDFYENLAMCDEAALENYFENGKVSQEEIKKLIKERKVFPCCFGSALKLTGVSEFLLTLEKYVFIPEYKDEFGAKVFKITRDKQGSRLTHMKITGGSLKVKDFLTDQDNIEKNDTGEEKVDQIRIYSGEKYTIHDDVGAGTICTVTGLTKTYSGQVFGIEDVFAGPVLEPVLTYQIIFKEGVDAYSMLAKLHQLEEEDPLLNIIWDEQFGEIHARVMGEVEIEILKSIIKERFNVEVEFGFGSLIYKETIRTTSIGVGHFEPLRHYAEVHLLLEPGDAGSGLSFATDCSEDILSRNWQRLILTHLEEKQHKGVLTGSDITDMKITLIAGKAHIKHTEGGDFRQAVYRAVRHGLKKAESILLEPFYEFQLEIPVEMTGRALSDIQKMNGRYMSSEIVGEQSIISGYAPVSNMRDYHLEVISYSKGCGRLFCTFSGYEPCHNAEEVINLKGYDFEKDIGNTANSVFCTHGAGFIVNYEDVTKYMHLNSDSYYSVYANMFSKKQIKKPKEYKDIKPLTKVSDSLKEDKELEEIFVRTYGESKRDRNLFKRSESPKSNRNDKKIALDNVDENREDINRTDDKTSNRTDNRTLNKTSNQTDSRTDINRLGINGEDIDSADTDGVDKNDVKENDIDASNEIYINKKPAKKDRYLLVDGYNIIFAWNDLRELAKNNLESARYKLMDILCSYQGFTDIILIAVFDAYKVKGNLGSTEKYNNIHVVYTKEAETADQYIEKTVHKIGRKYDVIVATSDALEQMIIWGSGARRMSAVGLKDEIETARKEINEIINPYIEKTRNYPFQALKHEENSEDA